MQDTTLKTRTLGKSGIDVTEIGLGLWAVGGHWGPLDDDAALNAIDAALDADINFYDTADVYGNGHSEQLLARAMDGRRDQFIVATKLGWTGYDGERNASAYSSVAKLIEGVESNLRRLDTDYIDVIQNHIGYREANTDIFLEGFQKLREAGKVRAFGMSTSDFEFIKYFAADGNCATLQIDYSILNRTPEAEIFPFCQANNIGVIVRGGLAMGILTGKFDADATFPDDDHRSAWHKEPDKKQQFLADLEAVERLRALTSHERTLAHLALQFLLAHPAVSTIIPGGRSPHQVAENVKAGLMPPLTAEEMAAIDAIVAPCGGRKIWPA